MNCIYIAISQVHRVTKGLYNFQCLTFTAKGCHARCQPATGSNFGLSILLKDTSMGSGRAGHEPATQGCSINRILIVITISGPNDLKTNKIEGNNVFVLIIFYCLYCTLDVYIRHFYCLYIRHQRRLTNVYEERYQGKSEGTRMFFRNVFEYIFNK